MPSPTVHGIKRKPPRGTLARYRDRIVEVLGEVCGQRILIRSIHADGSNAPLQ
jgi:hypothetical protein